MDWATAKAWVLNARYIVGGLVLARLAQEVGQTRFIANITNGTFLSGLTTGILLAVRIIGICTFAYGFAYYAKKTAIEQNKERDG